MAAMDRRRAASKARRSADEQLDEMLAEHRARSAPTRRAQSLEPSTNMTPALKRTAATPKQTSVAPRQETVQVPIFPDVPPLPAGAGLLPLPPGAQGHGGGLGSGAAALLHQAREAFGGLGFLATPFPGNAMGSGSQAQMPVLPERGDLSGLHGDGGLPAGQVQVQGALQAGQGQRPGVGQHGEPVQGAGANGSPPGLSQAQSSPINPWTAAKLQEQQAGVAGSVGPTDQVELFRLQCLREAEQRFAEGVKQMVGEGKASSNASFKSVPEGSGVGGQPVDGGSGQPAGQGHHLQGGQGLQPGAGTQPMTSSVSSGTTNGQNPGMQEAGTMTTGQNPGMQGAGTIGNGQHLGTQGAGIPCWHGVGGWRWWSRWTSSRWWTWRWICSWRCGNRGRWLRRGHE